MRNLSAKAGLPGLIPPLAVVALVVLAACSGHVPEAAPLAIWDGGQLQRDEYESWIAWQGLEDSEESIRTLALIKSLAEAGRQRGIDGSAEVQLAAEAARHRVLMPALDEHLDSQIDISDAEVEALRSAHPDAFRQPRKLFLRGIYKRLPEDGTQRQTVRRQMEALRAQVVEGDDLERLAAEESDSQSRFRNGSIGFVDPETLPPAARRAVVNLQAGEISELIELPDGIAFYACERIKPAIRPDADEVRHKFRQNLHRQKRVELNRILKAEMTPRVQVTADADPALTAGEYSLPRDWIDPLIRLRIEDREPEDLTPHQKRRLLREWGFRVAMSDHAESLGLGDREPGATALRWRLEQAVATEELRRRVDARLEEPTEQQLRLLFEQRRARLNTPAAFEVAAIRFAGPGGSEQAAVIEQAQETVSRIKAGELDFEQAAREFSGHPSARNGGRLGWLTQQQIGSLDIRLIKPVRRLAPGEDTGLMRLKSGLWIVKLLQRREAAPLPFDQAREQLAERLREHQIQQVQEQVRREQLAAIELPPPED